MEQILRNQNGLVTITNNDNGINKTRTYTHTKHNNIKSNKQNTQSKHRPSQKKH